MPCELKLFPESTFFDGKQDIHRHRSIWNFGLSAAVGASAALDQRDLRTDQIEMPKALGTLLKQRASLELQIKDEEHRASRLEDLLIDGAFDRDAFLRKQAEITLTLAGLREKLKELPDPEAIQHQHKQLAELRKSLVLLYGLANRAEKRMIVENVWPNRTVCQKESCFEPYSWVVKADFDQTFLGGALERDRDRTSQDIAQRDNSLLEPLFAMLERLDAGRPTSSDGIS